MIWIGCFKSLQSALRKPRFTGAPLEVHTWLRSEIDLISPLVDWLVSLISGSRCVRGKEEFVELALREAVSNAMLHGNRMDARKGSCSLLLRRHQGSVHRRQRPRTRIRPQEGSRPSGGRKPQFRTRAGYPFNEIGYG
jgi:hypothetical protein